MSIGTYRVLYRLLFGIIGVENAGGTNSCGGGAISVPGVVGTPIRILSLFMETPQFSKNPTPNPPLNSEPYQRQKIRIIFLFLGVKGRVWHKEG